MENIALVPSRGPLNTGPAEEAGCIPGLVPCKAPDATKHSAAFQFNQHEEDIISTKAIHRWEDVRVPGVPRFRARI